MFASLNCSALAEAGVSQLWRAWSELTALVLPVICAGCGATNEVLCEHCRLMLVPNVARRMLGPASASGLPVFFGLHYQGLVRNILASYKESGSQWVAAALAAPLVAAVDAAFAAALREIQGGARETDYTGSSTKRNAGPELRLVAIPSSNAAMSRRGFVPVESVTAQASLRVHRDLRFTTQGVDQKLLTAGDRLLNRKGGLRALPGVRGKFVILIDDVVTSGATLLSASHAIALQGGTVVGAATIASTPLRSAKG